MGKDAAFDDVLKPSPHFALEVDFDGKPYVTSLTHPYNRAVNLTEPHRVLLGCFSGTGTSVREAIAAFLRVNGLARTAEHQRIAYQLVSGLERHQILVRVGDARAMYGADMADDYREHRTIPPAIARWVARAARIRKPTRVLDLATGTGALANQLAEISSHVTGMDVSEPFLRIAAGDAAQRGVRVRYLHDNCNRLPFHTEHYDVVTISLALHWLDPGRAARGIYSVLEQGGYLVIIDGWLTVPRRHPLARLLNTRGRLDAAAHARSLETRLTALGCPVRHLASCELDERRSIGIPFAKAFLSQEHLKAAASPGWEDPARMWRALERRFAKSNARAWMGTFRWAAFSFRRLG